MRRIVTKWSMLSTSLKVIELWEHKSIFKQPSGVMRILGYVVEGLYVVRKDNYLRDYYYWIYRYYSTCWSYICCWLALVYQYQVLGKNVVKLHTRISSSQFQLQVLMKAIYAFKKWCGQNWPFQKVAGTHPQYKLNLILHLSVVLMLWPI